MGYFTKTINLIIFLFFLTNSSWAQISGQINSYAKVTSLTGTDLIIDNVSLAPSVTFTQAFGVGQKVLLIQMKGATVNTSNSNAFGSLVATNESGNYELATITASSGAGPYNISLTSLVRNYDANRILQIVSVPQYTDVTVVGDIQALAWDKALGRGGIVTLEVSGTLRLEANIDVSAMGFRGGFRNFSGKTSCNDSQSYVAFEDDNAVISTGLNHAQKGESTADFTDNGIPNMEYARGPMLNGGGGGNSHNGGGGGGANFTAGGLGGNGWPGAGTCGTPASGGIGGIPLSYSSLENKVYMGGGGGGGQQNNGNSTRGGHGGGVIVLRANNIEVDCSGSYGFYANGQDALDAPGNDAAGGGGAGGTILLDINTFSLGCNLVIEADGGNGGNVNYNIAHGGGGGGGEGIILFKLAPDPNVNISAQAGIAGFDCNASCTKTGTDGTTDPTDYQIGWFIEGNLSALPITLLSFDLEANNDEVIIQWATQSEINTDYFEIERSSDLKNIEVLGRTPAQGNSSQIVPYQQIDPNPLPGLAYYRLRSVDLDGSVQYGPWKDIILDQTAELQVSVYPNPGIEWLTVELPDASVEGQAYIYNKEGKEIISHSFAHKAEFPVQHLPPGMYLIKITWGNQISIKKIILQ